MIRISLLLAVGATVSWPLWASTVETRTLSFAKGTSSATVKGTLKGDQIVDYTLRAKAGQSMRVAMTTSNTANYFNVMPPCSEDVAIFIGSTNGNEWTGALPADGVYKIRVYLMRSAARRGATARYTLTASISNEVSAAPGLGKAPADDAKVKGTPYHATGRVPCSMGTAARGSAQCAFGVVRGKPGNAEVHVTPPGGFERVLTFIDGKVTTQGDGNVKVGKDGDTWIVDVNDYEHYRIPDAVVRGG